MRDCPLGRRMSFRPRADRADLDEPASRRRLTRLTAWRDRARMKVPSWLRRRGFDASAPVEAVPRVMRPPHEQWEPIGDWWTRKPAFVTRTTRDFIDSCRVLIGHLVLRRKMGLGGRRGALDRSWDTAVDVSEVNGRASTIAITSAPTDVAATALLATAGEQSA